MTSIRDHQVTIQEDKTLLFKGLKVEKIIKKSYNYNGCI